VKMRRSVMATKKPAAKVLPHAFDVQEFLDSAGLSRRVVRFARGARAFAQGSPATSVFTFNRDK